MQVTGMFPVFENVLKGPESPAYMVENTVQHHPDSLFMEFTAQIRKVFVRSQSAVNLCLIPVIVTVRIRFKYR